MQNFNSAELRPVEFARAYLQKKMLKKPLREDAGADVLRDSPCSAHVSRKLCISPARITHRCLSLPPLIGAREHVLECVLEREFAKSLFSLPVICMQNSTGTYPRARDPHRRPRRPSEVHRQHSPQPPPARRHTMVRLEKGFVTGPSCAASARAPVSASLRCVQHHLHGGRGAGPYSHNYYSGNPVWPRGARAIASPRHTVMKTPLRAAPAPAARLSA